MTRVVLVVLAVLAVHAGCDDHGKSPAPFPCGAAMCSGGQLCRQDVFGIDAGAGAPPFCITPPPNCLVSDCSDGTCPPCLMTGCGCSSCSITLHDRELVCSGG